jgi:hypothetical protein
MASSHAFSLDNNGGKEVKVPALFMLVISLTMLAMFGLLFTVSML